MNEANAKRCKEGLVALLAVIWIMMAIACSMVILNHLGVEYIGPALFNIGFHGFGIWYFVKHSFKQIRQS